MKSYITGQGDNQVCKVMIPVPKIYAPVDHYLQAGEDLERKIVLFLDTLTHESSEFGLTGKPDETCVK
jgi:hypothetical protein